MAVIQAAAAAAAEAAVPLLPLAYEATNLGYASTKVLSRSTLQSEIIDVVTAPAYMLPRPAEAAAAVAA